MTPINVMIVDDHAIFREGITALLTRIDTVVVIGEAGTAAEAIDLAARLQPDVILMDLQLPDGGGVAATETILASSPGIAILVLTMHDDDGHVRDVLRAGARGYLLKDSRSEAIVDGITAVHRGQLIFDKGVAQHLQTVTTSAHPRRPFPSLTSREFDILDRLARGLTNQAIAARMGINTKTVQNNVSNILLKLEARDRAQAVAIARDAGLGH
jgi:DNA-binding NarL/FixJ family response regulator